MRVKISTAVGDKHRDVAVFDAQGKPIPPDKPYCIGIESDWCCGWEWYDIPVGAVIISYWPEEFMKGTEPENRLFASIQTEWGQVELTNKSSWRLAYAILGVCVGDDVSTKIECVVRAAWDKKQQAT